MRILKRITLEKKKDNDYIFEDVLIDEIYGTNSYRVIEWGDLYDAYKTMNIH